MISYEEMNRLTPQEMRGQIRQEQWTDITVRLGLGYVQANLVILPREMAFEFTVFCMRNPAPCPILEVTEVGSPLITMMASHADLRTDLPRYKVFVDGKLVDEPTNITKYWQDDFVGFLIGCSASQSGALLAAGVPVRAEENHTNDSVYITNIPCNPYGRFHGPMVVSMRPMPKDKIVRAVQVTTRFRDVHGVPLHIGDPKEIGIDDITQVDFGCPPDIREGEVPVFWGCGITPQTVAAASRPRIMITHYPCHMFITDKRDAEIAIL